MKTVLIKIIKTTQKLIKLYVVLKSDKKIGRKKCTFLTEIFYIIKMSKPAQAVLVFTSKIRDSLKNRDILKMKINYKLNRRRINKKKLKCFFQKI